MLSTHQSSATMLAIAAYENPRPVANKPNTIAFDVQIYLGTTILTGVVRYYNNLGITFGDTGAFIFSATVARIGKDSLVESENLEAKDYDIEGDVQWLYLLAHGATMDNWKDSVSINRLPILTVSGQAIRRNAKDFKFDIDVDQYTSFGRKISPLPLTVTVPQSGKYKDPKKRPLPGEGAIVSFSGPMIGLIGTDPFRRRFAIDLDKISFLCRASDINTPLKGGNDVRPTPNDSSKKMKVDFSKLFLTGGCGDKDMEKELIVQKFGDDSDLTEEEETSPTKDKGKGGKREREDDDAPSTQTRAVRSRKDASAGPSHAGPSNLKL